MKIQAIIAIVAAAFITNSAFAQTSKSDVNINNVIATNAAVLGSTAKQQIDLGNAKGGGQSTVNGKNVIVTNAAVLG
jgi:hypothetical protein